jgi:hypothetical protein
MGAHIMLFLSYNRYDFTLCGPILSPEIGSSFFPKYSKEKQWIQSFGVGVGIAYLLTLLQSLDAIVTSGELLACSF